ncbi:MAG: ankyrin repeat domain-containing protein [Steroidobacteraceae bacterium]
MTRWLVAAAGLWVVCGAAYADPGLADLIQAGQDAAALKQVNAGANVNVPQGDGSTPLDWASYRLDKGLVKALLRHGANPNAMNNFGSSPLEEAVKAADLDLVKVLIRAGAKVDLANADDQTPLMLASRIGTLKIVKLLVRHGANVNAREKWRGQTAIMWAAAEGHADVTEYLVKHGAKVNMRAIYNDWLDKATQITSEPRAQYRPEGGLTPLLYAVRSGCMGCVQALLKGGADINKPTPEGVTPLMSSIDNLHYDVAKYLLQHGANPNAWDWYGRTPLYIAVDMHTYAQVIGDGRRGRGGRGGGPAQETRATQPDQTTAIDIIRMLLDAGVDPNAQLDLHRPGRGGNSGRFVDDLLRTGCTPLLLAAITHDTEAIPLLLQHGALVDLPNINGVTPLVAAAGVGSAFGGLFGGRGDFSPNAESNAVNTIALLLKAGANINARVTDTSSLTARIARASGMTNRQGQTALYGAISLGWPKVVQYLLQHGAQVNVKDDMGRTPLMAATRGAGGRGRGFRPVKQIIAMLSQASAGEEITSTRGAASAPLPAVQRSPLTAAR